MVFLGLDIGTSSLKAALVDTSGEVLAHATESYDVESPEPGWAESDPERWWAAAVAATAQVLRATRSELGVEAIGMSGQMHGIVLTGDDGSAKRHAILWADDRATAVLTRYRSLPADVRKRLGNPLLPGMAGPILVWLAEHEPDVLAGARWALSPKDWLRMQLIGTAATDPSDASGTLLYDIPADDWAFELLPSLGLNAALLPQVLPSTAVAGPLHPDAARALGLPHGTPVVAGAADTAAAAIGTGAVEVATVRLTIGTGAQVIALRGAPRIDPQLRTHCYRSAVPGQWYAMAAVQNAGLALDWLRRVFGADWAELEMLADDPLRADGPLFVPFLTPERPHQPDGAMGGRFLDVRLDHTRRDLLRAGLEGVACGIRDALDALGDGDSGDPLRIAGGGTRQAAWCRMLADVTGRRLEVVDTPAASARGAALLAGVGIGAWESVSATAVVAPRTGMSIEPRGERVAAFATLQRRYRAAWGQVPAGADGP